MKTQITALMLLLLATTTLAWDCDTHKEIARQAGLDDFAIQHACDADQQSYQKLYNGIGPTNHHCENNYADCAANLKAKQFLQDAQGTDQEMIAIAEHLFADSTCPAHWYSLDSNCHAAFEADVGDKIRANETNWAVVRDCKQDNGTSKRIYANPTTIQEAANYVHQQIQTTPNASIPNITTSDHFIAALNTKDNATTIIIENEVLKRTWDASCLLSSQRKQELYDRYRTLSESGKQCLQLFLSGNQTIPQYFSNLCQALGNQYYLGQFVLEEYVTKEFANPKVNPITTDYSALLNGNAITTTTSIRSYFPVDVSPACIIEFKQRQQAELDAYKIGEDRGLKILLILLIFFTLFAYYYFLSWAPWGFQN